jgi:four helix bundle protein
MTEETDVPRLGSARFEDLEVWQAARLLVTDIYRATSAGEYARDFGLRDQTRRAAVSVMSNIAEGFERDGNKELVQFLALAKGSCCEVRSHLCVAADQGYLSLDESKRQGQSARPHKPDDLWLYEVSAKLRDARKKVSPHLDDQAPWNLKSEIWNLASERPNLH